MTKTVVTTTTTCSCNGCSDKFVGCLLLFVARQFIHRPC